MRRALALRSRGTPGAAPKTFSRRGVQQEACTENGTAILRRVTQTRPEGAGTGMSPPVARILLPTALILGKLGAATPTEIPRRQVGCRPPFSGGFCMSKGSCLSILLLKLVETHARTTRAPSERAPKYGGMQATRLKLWRFAAPEGRRAAYSPPKTPTHRRR